MKLIDDIKYNYKHYIKSKPRLYFAIILKLLVAYAFILGFNLVFPNHPLFEPIWFGVIMLIFPTIAIVVTTFKEHTYKGYLQVKHSILQEFKEELFANNENKFAMEEVYNMLPEHLKGKFIEAIFKYRYQRRL